MAAVAETCRPLVIPTPDHQVNLVPAAAGGAGVPRWPVVRAQELAIGRRGGGRRIAETNSPDRIGRAEWVVGRDRPVGVVAQDLAAKTRRVLRLGSHVVLAHG